MLRSFRVMALAVLAASTLLGACAQQRDPINRVQPNGVDKSLFQGEWYSQKTVVQIPATYSHTFVGENEWQGMERVRWDIQEEWLYARRSFERIKNGEVDVVDDTMTKDGTPYMGSIIAAFRIQSHFDIKRAYNPTTGEEYNVIDENTTDRPWYERQYMRVDWSKNHATNFGYMVENIQQDPVAYYVQDPNDPDYPIIFPGRYDDNGDMIEEPYIDVTNVMMTQPTMTYIQEIDESYPTCWFFEFETQDCTAEPIKIRNSFLRINPRRQYAPIKMAGKATDYFGIFRQERLVWDERYGVNNRERVAFAQLHNLWQQWFDAEGNLLPAANRTVRPMVYYAIDWPPEYDHVLADVEAEWNKIFQDAVGAAMGTEFSGQVFRICHSPVVEGDDHELCGETGFSVRVGDIRHSYIKYVPDFYDGFRLLGFGPSNTDPITGEAISAMVYMYTWNKNVVQSTIDMVQMLNGDLDSADWIDMYDVRAFAEEAAKPPRTQTFTRADLDGIVAAQSFDSMRAIGLHASPEAVAQLDGISARDVLRRHGGSFYEAGLFSGDMVDSDGRLAALQDTYLERLAMNDEMKLAAGILPSTPEGAFTEDMLKHASVARLGPTRVLSAIQRTRDQILNRRELDVMRTGDDLGYFGLAVEYKGWDPEDIRPEIGNKVFHAVLAHELGHTFTLHHNFGGTDDAVNYFDEYWKLRSTDGYTKPASKDNVGPRWEDPETTAELEANIFRYAYSSIMDYSRLTLDYGPGKYDRAAILFAYADKVEAFSSVGQVAQGIPQEWSSGDGTVLQFWNVGPASYHYTKWYKDMGDLVWDPSNRVLIDASTVNWDTGKGLNADGVALNRVPYVFCSPYQSDIGNSCYTRDYGADEYERVRHHVQVANTWYITRAFTRYEVGKTQESYIGRSYDRIYGRLKGVNDYYALIIGILETVYTPAQIQAFLTDGETGWGGYTAAEGLVVDFLLSTLAMPDVKQFEQTTDPAGQPLWMEGLFGGPLQTDAISGRYFTTTWWDSNYDDQCGMYFFQCLHHFGFYLDKIMALEALSDAQTYFVARDTSEDVRQWRISFWDNWAPVMNDFVGGVLAQDYAAFAPRGRVGSGSRAIIEFPTYSDPAKPLPVGTPVDSATGFSVQLYAAILGMARFQNNFDKSFMDSTRMWLRGSPFAVDNANGCVQYVDQPSGKIYRAINMPDGVAKRMLGRAVTLFKRTQACADMLTSDPDTPDPNYCGTGTPPTLTCAATVDARAKGELQKYVQLLDVVVDLTGYYETYTQQYGDPYNPGGIP